MKAESINDVVKSGFYELFRDKVYGDDCEFSLVDMIDWIQHRGSSEQSLEGNWLVLNYCLEIDGVEFKTVGKKFMKNLEGREDMADYIIIEEKAERRNLFIQSEIDRILEVIEIDKEDGFNQRKEVNLEKEVIEGLKNKGLTIKTELRCNSRTGKNDRIVFITW
jgi:hypothetical protein